MQVNDIIVGTEGTEYKIIRLMGGGMSEVGQATIQNLPPARRILPIGGVAGPTYRAIKKLNPRLFALQPAVTNAAGQFVTPRMTNTGFTEAELRNRFLREAQILGALRHPKIPRFYDYFERGGEIFIVMDWIDGQPLEFLLHGGRQSRYTEEQAKRLALEILEILEYLHTLPRPVIFRDLKPANIMILPKGEVQLIDFGIIKEVTLGTQIVNVTQPMGTPGYTPQEQILGNPCPASDIFALGCVLREVLTLLPPPQQGAVPPVRQDRPGISLGFEAVISRATRDDHLQRFQSAAEMAEAIKMLDRNPLWSLTLSGWQAAEQAFQQFKAGVRVGFPRFPIKRRQQIRQFCEVVMSAATPWHNPNLAALANERWQGVQAAEQTKPRGYKKLVSKFLREIVTLRFKDQAEAANLPLQPAPTVPENLVWLKNGGWWSLKNVRWLWGVCREVVKTRRLPDRPTVSQLPSPATLVTMQRLQALDRYLQPQKVGVSPFHDGSRWHFRLYLQVLDSWFMLISH